MKSRSAYITPAIHLLAWLVVLLVPVLVFHNAQLETGLPDGFFYLTNIYHIGLFYLLVYIVYPRLLNRRWWWTLLILLPLIMLASYRIKLFFLQEHDPAFQVTEQTGRFIFFPPFPFIAASLIFFFVTARLRREKKEKEKQAQRLSTELRFLRSQVSPHFLFNVMTNMVALARQKSDLLEPSLIRFSELLRYMLYETNNDRFPVSKEAEYLQNYIDLQELRFSDSVKVNRQISIDNPGCSIEPMLLIPFVENAFKHGIGLTEDPFIDIRLEVNKGQLYFLVRNNYSKDNTTKDNNSGIGLVNVKNRLTLLYNKKHQLRITDNNDIYTAELNLQLEC